MDTAAREFAPERGWQRSATWLFVDAPKTLVGLRKNSPYITVSFDETLYLLPAHRHADGG
jgi:hypothetical protein